MAHKHKIPYRLEFDVTQCSHVHGLLLTILFPRPTLDEEQDHGKRKVHAVLQAVQIQLFANSASSLRHRIAHKQKSSERFWSTAADDVHRITTDVTDIDGVIGCNEL